MQTKMTDLQRLNEMGITLWQPKAASAFALAPLQNIVLPKDCQLLYLSDAPPLPNEMALFANIIASMKIALNQTYYLPAQAVTKMQTLPPLCWFAGVKVPELAATHVLHSAALSQLSLDLELKKQLWRQIKDYDATSSH